MSVSAAVASHYAALSAAATTSAGAAKSAASAVPSPSATTSSSPDVVVTLSDKALELMRLRQISAENAQQFKDILAKAKASQEAQADPKAFLHSLSSSDMEVLRQVHSLAEPIHIATLTDEGATNLLVQPGSAQDLNNDGLTACGAGYGFTFPPQNAPASFKAAWASASEGLSFADIPTHMIFAVGLANLGREPGDPNWRNPYADPNYDYQGAVSRSMDAVQFTYEQGGMSQERYQLEMDFYTRLTKAMG